ncbi:uncharacterized protein PRCAT00005247001 [Priceomyces carsonii]|uniref:uncharacterized protein n=1 Tax=Priceomyces carsonii TaxID=28549 RepID=UPI002ED932ED|nr:unnamed protein product [Priceomyces carsonii]
MSVFKLPPKGKVAVLGSGISGLTFSYFLSKLRPDIKIAILEQKPRAGGYIKSDKLQGDALNENIIFEKGPRTLRGVSYGSLLIIDILKSLNCIDQIEAISKNSVSNRKFLLGQDKDLIEVPHSFKSFVEFIKSGILSGIPKAIVRESFNRTKLKANEDESIESFFERHFKTKVLNDRVLSAIIHGIYAGDTSKLSIRSIFPRLVNMEKENGSIIAYMIKKLFQKKAPAAPLPQSLIDYERYISKEADLDGLIKKLSNYPMIRLREGLESLVTALSGYIAKQENIDVKYDTNISEIDIASGTIKIKGSDPITFDHVRSTINSNSLAQMIPNDAKEVKDLLHLHYVSIFLCNIYSEGHLIPKNKNGFGFLVPKSVHNPESLLGVIFDSDIEQNSVPLFDGPKYAKEMNYSKVTLMLGGHYYDDLGKIPSSSMNLEIVEKILNNILHFNTEKHNLIIRNEALDNEPLVSLKANDLLISYTFIDDCIPQFNVGYDEQKRKLLKVLDEASRGRFSIGGTSFGNGVGVPDCVLNSLEAALKMK